MNQQLAPDLGDVVERFDHVSVAVRDIRGTLPLVALLNGQFCDGGDSGSGDFRWVQFDLPGSGRLELITPLSSADSDNFLVRFLDTSGEGLHHITLKVTDLDQAIARATELGLDVVGVNCSDPAWKEAFVHPKSANGVLVQIAEWQDGPATRQTLAEFLSDGLQ
ncbi:MAG: VOC family protein [Acidimicrobiia bacterium]|nr:VOC family protein [Acidimicrobiia bacterium]MDX2466671.1 VOC family protein [Acidimicrobiia bacterium]